MTQNQRVKLLMSWDVEDDKESEYYNFVVNDFIPLAKRIGLQEIQFWFTTFGNVEQIQASGMATNMAQMNTIISSEEWDNLITRLNDLVSDFEQKIIPGTLGFQL